MFNGRGIIFTAVFNCFPPVDVPDLGCSEGKATLAYQLLVREGENVGRTLSDSNWLSPAYSKKKKSWNNPRNIINCDVLVAVQIALPAAVIIS